MTDTKQLQPKVITYRIVQHKDGGKPYFHASGKAEDFAKYREIFKMKISYRPHPKWASSKEPVIVADKYKDEHPGIYWRSMEGLVVLVDAENNVLLINPYQLVEDFRYIA